MIGMYCWSRGAQKAKLSRAFTSKKLSPTISDLCGQNSQMLANFPAACTAGPRIGGKPRLEHHARFHVLESRDALLQLHVYAHRAGDGAHRAAPHAELANRRDR